jgi:RHS repeat-associated protein
MHHADGKHSAMYLFYVKGRVVCQVGAESARLMRAGNTVLAQLHTSSTLLQVDGANTVIAALTSGQKAAEAYSPYGYSGHGRRLALVGFTGQWRDTVTGCYPLGNGHRLFSPLTGRFVGPDRSSPFGSGGLNVYGYCGGDPINRTDPSGRAWVSITGLQKAVGLMDKTGLSQLLKDAGYPQSVKVFIKAFNERPADLSNLVLYNTNGIHGVMKQDGRFYLHSITRADYLSFGTHHASKNGSFGVALKSGELPLNVKGYAYKRDPAHLPPNYENLGFASPVGDEEPPAYGSLSASTSCIRGSQYRTA